MNGFACLRLPEHVKELTIYEAASIPKSVCNPPKMDEIGS